MGHPDQGEDVNGPESGNGPRQRTALSLLIEDAVRRGVARALAEHKRAGRSVVIMRDGVIVELSPDEIPDYDFDNDPQHVTHRLRVL